MEGIPDCGFRDLFTGITDDAVSAAPGAIRGREALEAHSEANRGRRQGCQRLGIASRRGEENAPKDGVRKQRTKAQSPPKRNIGVVKHRILRSRSGARVPMTSAEAHEVRVLVVE